MTTTTTFVLVPGAWLGGWAWKKVTPLLQEKGHAVYPITLTRMGERVHLASSNLSMETAIEDVLNVIRYNDLNDIVLVGHSYAGKVAAAVADRASERIRRVLYLDGFHPEKGARTPQGAFPDEFPVSGSVVSLPLEFLLAVGKDVQAANREWMLSKATATPVRYLRDPITLSGKLDSVKTGYIYCGQGDTLPWYLSQASPGKSVDEVLKENLDGPFKIIDSGHWPMITKPKELAEDMLSLS
jgi:pimeloyl-ACP methyl ester carboxylesterase